LISSSTAFGRARLQLSQLHADPCDTSRQDLHHKEITPGRRLFYCLVKFESCFASPVSHFCGFFAAVRSAGVCFQGFSWQGSDFLKQARVLVLISVHFRSFLC
jgi:hypothetical protein